MMQFYLAVALALVPAYAGAESSLEDFAASLLCVEDCPHLDEGADTGLGSPLNMVNGVPLPEDADMQKIEIQRALVDSGRYLTTDGTVADLLMSDERQIFSRQEPGLQTSSDVIPQPAAPTPFIIDPRTAKAPQSE